MPARHIGYACINVTLSDDLPLSKRILTSRTLRMASFSPDKVNDLILQNSKDLLTILQWNKKHDISLFRISSEMFPFMDHPDYSYTIDSLKNGKQIKHILSECGKFAKENKIRLTTHPGPYNCLGSPNIETVDKTILCIEMHRLLGELLGMDDFVINIHVGGSYGGDFENTAARFYKSFYRLSKQAQKWLTVENDDKKSLWSVTKLHKLIHKKVNIPIVFDAHHWAFCNEESVNDAVKIAFSTWGNKTPKIHYSESAIGKKQQAHSDYITNQIPVYSDAIQYDVMFEAKMKEKAILKYRENFVQ